MPSQTNTPDQPVSYELLNQLWLYCRDVFDLIDQIDVTQLNAGERKELQAIEQITAGYAVALLEQKGLAVAQTHAQFKPIQDLIHSHCSRAHTALTDVVLTQSGQKRKRRIAL